MNKGKKILFLTTSNLATNPRLVKEMDLAIELGYRVSVISFSFENWSAELNDQIKKRFVSSIELTEIPGGRKPILPWLLSTFFHELNKIYYLFTSNNLSVISFALIKRTWLLHNELKKKRAQVDLIVAHNPGSFYPAYIYSKKTKIPFGIDVEDYHPGETNDSVQSSMMKKMMQTVLPAAAFVSAASPLILEKIKEDCNKELKWTEIVLNYFDQDQFISPVHTKKEKLQIVWFSQYISERRGLEQLIETMNYFLNEVELHLYGSLNEDFYKKYISTAANIVIHPAVPQNELHEQLANYDIGLAVEDASTNLNRDICLTNKLVSYFQAGLYILATDTSAQKQFLKQYPEHGIVTKLKREDLKDAIEIMIDEKIKLRQTAIIRYNNSRNDNSRNELRKLVSCWDIAIKKNIKNSLLQESNAI